MSSWQGAARSFLGRVALERGKPLEAGGVFERGAGLKARGAWHETHPELVEDFEGRALALLTRGLYAVRPRPLQKPRKDPRNRGARAWAARRA